MRAGELMRALLAVLLLLIGLLLCAACGGEAAQERAPAQPEAEQPSAAVPAVASTSAETQALDASATTNGAAGANKEAAAGEEADDCRIDAPPDGSKPLDLGTVTVHGDRPAAEARTIREGIAAVWAYHRELGRNFRGVLHVHSYSTFFDTDRHMVAHGDSLNAHYLLQIGYKISTDWSHGGPPATGEPRLWLVRSDRLSAASAFAAYLLRHYPGYNQFLKLDPLAVRGLASYVAYQALERAGFGSVERCLATAAAAWRDSGQGWLEAIVAEGLLIGFGSSSDVDDTAMLTDAADWGLSYTMRLFGALALHWLQFDPASVFSSGGRRLIESVPELRDIDREALGDFLRQSGVIPPPSDPIDVVIRWSPDALGDRTIGAIRLEQRHYFWGAISKQWVPETPSFAAREIGEAELQASVPAGTYNLVLEIDGEEVIVGVFAITPTGIRPAAPGAVLQGFEIAASNHEMRIERVPSFVELELGSDPATAGDLVRGRYDLCSAGEWFIWCWDPKGTWSDWPVSYTVPAGRYVLRVWRWIPEALVEISDTDARIVEQYPVEIPDEDGVNVPEAEMAFERMEGGWRLVISEEAGS